MAEYDDLLAGYEVNGKIIPDPTSENEYSDLIEGYEVKGEYIPTRREKNAEKVAEARQSALDDMNDEIGAWDSFFINMGRGITNVGRGVGLIEEEDELTKQAFASLKERRPYTSAGGEITGEALPFLIPGTAIGKVESLLARAGLSGILGATEGGVLANAKNQDVVQGSLLGLSLGAGFEVLAPVVGRYSRKIFSRLTGRTPKGALLDDAGRPTPEFQQALDENGITVDDLAADVRDFVSKQKPGTQPQQSARAAQFNSEDIPASRADISQNFADRATEEQLLKSASDKVAEPFRQFKLTQSQAIRKRLDELTPNNPLPEETGELIKDALIGKKKLLRTQKNALYKQAAEAADHVGGIPMFTDNIKQAVPDADTLDDLAITAPQAAESLQGILKRYGIIDPSPEEIENGFKAVPLDMKSFERFRKSLNAIDRGDNTGAISVAVSPIKEALDNEAAELGETLAKQGFGDEVVEPLKEARKLVRQMKTEFSPQSIVGRLVDTKKDGVTNIIEASKVYDKLAAKSLPVEDVRKVVSNLRSSGEKGQQALASMQATTLLDLIDSGFSTQSRKIDGIAVFNPVAFKKRIQQIGPDKLKAIFGNNPQALKRINNIDQIAKLITPTADATPKGSAPVIMDLMNRLGVISVSSKIPGGGLIIEGLTGLSQNAKTRQDVTKAMTPKMDVQRITNLIDETFPGIASAFGISATYQDEEQP